jgi:hypothetical protein
MYSTMGDFPVPPTARLPTVISGKWKVEEGRYFLSNNQFLNFTIPP